MCVFSKLFEWLWGPWIMDRAIDLDQHPTESTEADATTEEEVEGNPGGAGMAVATPQEPGPSSRLRVARSHSRDRSGSRSRTPSGGRVGRPAAAPVSPDEPLVASKGGNFKKLVIGTKGAAWKYVCSAFDEKKNDICGNARDGVQIQGKYYCSECKKKL